MKNAVGYVRCSTTQQEDSPEQQKKEILAYAEKHGYTIIEWFEDFGKSGTTFDQRPEFMRLKGMVEGKPNFTAVICYDESRWGRAIDSEENTYWRFHFRDKGVDILLVHTSVDRKNDFAAMISAFEGVQASQYSKNLSGLTLRGAKNNGIYSSGGSAAYGYTREAVHLKTGVTRILPQGVWCSKGQEKVKLIPGEEYEIQTVRYIFERRALGVGCIVIAQELNERNVPCPKRGKWKNRDQKWSAGTVNTIVQNPVYCGYRVYNRLSSSKIQARLKGREVESGVPFPQWRNDKSDWTVTEGAHEPLVEKEVWDAANRERRTKSTKSRTRQTSEYLLTGIMKCAKCGFNYQGASAMVRGKRYYRYVCGGYNSKRVCPSCSVGRDKLEAFAIQSVREVISDQRMMGAIEQELAKLIQDQPESDRIEKDRHNCLIIAADEKIRNLTMALEKGIGLDSVIERLKEVENERRMLIEQGEKLGVRPTRTQLNPEEIGKAVREFVANFEKQFATASIADRRALIAKCIQQIEVDPDTRSARFYVRRLPAVNAQVEALYAPPEANMKAGGRLFSNVSVPGTGLEPA